MSPLSSALWELLLFWSLIAGCITLLVYQSSSEEKQAEGEAPPPSWAIAVLFLLVFLSPIMLAILALVEAWAIAFRKEPR